MRPVNDAGLRLIMSFESFRSMPYEDEGGLWTIGYGHTNGITADTAPITEADAQVLLKADVQVAEDCVCSLITVHLTDNQYAALVSLVYNAGVAPLQRMLGARLNSGDYTGAAQEFLRWRLAGGMVSDGLVRRREAERALFISPDATA